MTIPETNHDEDYNLAKGFPVTVYDKKRKALIPCINLIITRDSITTAPDGSLNADVFKESVMIDSEGTLVGLDDVICDSGQMTKKLTAMRKIPYTTAKGKIHTLDWNEKVAQAIVVNKDIDRSLPLNTGIVLNSTIRTHVERMIEGMDVRFMMAMSDISDLADHGELYAFLKRIMFLKHGLITGESGQGKTFIIDALARSFNPATHEYITYTCHSGTEAIDFLGYMIPLAEGGMAWKDGSLTKAFRLASSGKKVTLFLDELLRCPPLESNIFIGALTPNSKGNFVLDTGRPIGEVVDGRTDYEQVECPMENLWCVAATNQGAGYQSAPVDRAMKDRFRVFYQEMTLETVTSILDTKLVENGAPSGSAMLTSMLKMMESTSKLVNAGSLSTKLSIRHMVEAISMCRGDLINLPIAMKDMSTAIIDIDSDGRFNPEQSDIVEMTMRSAMRLPKGKK